MNCFYIRYFLIILMFISFSLISKVNNIPFNVKRHNGCDEIKNNKKDKFIGTIRLFSDKYILQDKVNATRSLVSPIGKVELKDSNDQAGLDRWITWIKEDMKEKRLFRYLMFYDVMGIMENEFTFLPHCQEDYRDNGPVLRKKALGQIEDFQLFIIKKLTVSFKEYKTKHKRSDKPGFIDILNGYDIWEKYGLMEALKQTDIRYLQENNPGSVFQLASNFDCLEGHVASNGLEYMNRAPVQGENAVSTTMGAGITRAYFIKPEHRNLLGGLKKNYKKTKLDENDSNDIAIGLHKDVVVTSGYYPPFVRTNENNKKIVDLGGADSKDAYIDLTDKVYQSSVEQISNSNKDFFGQSMNRLEFLFKNKYADNESFVNEYRNPVYVFNKAIEKDDVVIDQIFTATSNIKFIYPQKDHKVTTKKKFYDKLKVDGNMVQNNCKIILKAMYKGTVLAAAMRGKKKLFLTLVGAGAFYNEISWVMDALNDDDIIDAIAYTGMEVVIIIFPDIRPGRGVDGKNFDETKEDILSENDIKSGKKGTALKGIKNHTEKLNKAIKKQFEVSQKPKKTIQEVLDEAYAKNKLSLDQFAQGLKTIAKK